MTSDVNRLVSIRERLELFPEPNSSASPAPSTDSDGPGEEPAAPSREVFVVHGHDDAAREMTARLLEQLQIKTIVLHEQANRGQTIIEKLERHANVAFAVVLLTPDDFGGSAVLPE